MSRVQVASDGQGQATEEIVNSNNNRSSHAITDGQDHPTSSASGNIKRGKLNNHDHFKIAK